MSDLSRIEQIRVKAMDWAVSLSSVNTEPATVVAMAADFERYITTMRTAVAN